MLRSLSALFKGANVLNRGFATVNSANSPQMVFIGSEHIPKEIKEYLKKKGVLIASDSSIYAEVWNSRLKEFCFHKTNQGEPEKFYVDLDLSEYIKTLVGEDAQGTI